MKSRAMVLIAEKRLEMMEMEVPPVRPGEALLRVEACGMCGTDIQQYRGTLNRTTPECYPVIPGHEPVGIIEEISAEAAKNWGVAAGDRVAVLPMICCGMCDHCLGGQHHRCKGVMPFARPAYGFVPITYEHGLWGGYGEYIHLHPRTLLCKVPPEVPAKFAAMYQSLASGIRWAVQIPETVFSDSVLILGCGQRGLAAVTALRAAGVQKIIVTGLARDRYKLRQAKRLGASDTIVVDEENTVERVMAITNDRGVDVALDVVPYSTQSFLDAIEAIRPGGTIVVAGVKGPNTRAALATDRILYKEITVKGAFTQKFDAYQKAVELLSRNLSTLEALHTHEMPIDRLEEALAMLSGETPGAEVICMSVHPHL